MITQDYFKELQKNNALALLKSICLSKWWAEYDALTVITALTHGSIKDYKAKSQVQLFN